MRRGLILIFILAHVLALPSGAYAMFGLEIAPLLELVSGQVKEIEQMSETLGVAKENYGLLVQINRGIENTVRQIQSIQTIVERAQGLDPSSVKSLSDLNDLLSRANKAKEAVDDLMSMKVALADAAITQSALQGDTAYKMGQEMVVVGSDLSQESQSASPGRAEQISAAAGSAQMLAQGVELQTLAQMVQLQAMSLEFQKSEVQRGMDQEELRRSLFERRLKPKVTRP